MNMYNILGKFNDLDPKATPAKEDVKAEPVYESVEARGSITEAVRSLEEKYQGFKKTVAAVKKGGSAEDPEAVAAAIDRKKYGKEKFQKAAAAGKKLGEAAKPDYIDLDKDGNKTEPMKKAAKDAKKKTVKEGEYDPAAPDADAIAKRKRLQALRDKQEEKDDWFDGKEKAEPNVRVHHAKYQDEPETDDLDEVAPPGAKAERMVKHIKKGYAKDGKLTKREKGIAYATAWKAHNKGQVEEGVEFGDTIENSKAELKKAKPAKLKESRMLQEGDYFYEKVAKALAEKNPALNTADSSFVTAVRQEMVAQGIEPNRARNIIMTDEDFISDVATSYAHYCKEVAECNAPMNSFVDGTVDQELDEIARLAGLPTISVKETEVYNEVNHEESADSMDEGAGTGVLISGKPVNISSIEVDGVNDWDAPDFADAYITYAEFEDGTPLSEPEMDQLADQHGDLVNQAAHNSLHGRADFVDEDTVGEGNEFSGALAAAKASGKKEFEVGGKKYTVKEAVNTTITVNSDGTDAVMLIKQLAGIEPMPDEPLQQPVQPETVPTDNTVPAEPAQPEAELEEEREVEYLNTPREKVAPADAAYPSGTDMHRAKKSYSDKPYRGDNPMAVKETVEDSLWKKYSGMLKSLIVK